MNALSPDLCVPPIKSGDEKAAGHLFRSKLIDRLALVERWAVGIFHEAAIMPCDGKTAGQLHLLGQKLAKLKELASTDPPLFKTPKRVIDLLAELERYADLRSTLAHATLSISERQDGSLLFTFDPTGPSPSDSWIKRVSLRADELVRLNQEASRLANDLTQQKLRARPSPSLQPPPRPAAAAGP
jgi:hypothetical protein